ncbi:hypothetical protein B0H34DRAFT_260598 [Crassisporium funariophilum]|nr:hypothetical protein B0H34DRAFT_260598 [Crassisporium funariophilum]
MATAQAIALFNALKNIRVIKSKLAATGGALTSTVFSTSGALPDMNLDNARAAIGLEFESLVQNIRAVKPNDPIATAYPDIHYNLAAQIARRNGLAHEYGTTAPIKLRTAFITAFQKSRVGSLLRLGHKDSFLRLGNKDILWRWKRLKVTL